MGQENTQNEGEDQNNAESISDVKTQETSVDTVADLQQQLKDKDRTIQEEVNRRQTMETRFSQPVASTTPIVPEVSAIDRAKQVAANLIDDPDLGATELNNLIQNAVEKGKTEATAIISVNNEINSLQTKHPHLDPFMPLIKQKASELMNAGYKMKDALKTASDEYQKIFTKMTGNKTSAKSEKPTDEQSSMKGNMSNKANNIAPPARKAESLQDEFTARNATLRSKFSLSK